MPLRHLLADHFYYATVISDQQSTNSVRTKRRIEIGAWLRSTALALLWIFRAALHRRHIYSIDVYRGPETIEWCGSQQGISKLFRVGRKLGHLIAAITFGYDHGVPTLFRSSGIDDLRHSKDLPIRRAHDVLLLRSCRCVPYFLSFKRSISSAGLLASARIPLVGPFVAAALRQSITCSPLSVSGTRTTKTPFLFGAGSRAIGSFGEPGNTSASFFVGWCITVRYRVLSLPLLSSAQNPLCVP